MGVKNVLMILLASYSADAAQNKASFPGLQSQQEVLGLA
jgi:hypothetical protein